jgi:hypothetical protein
VSSPQARRGQGQQRGKGRGGGAGDGTTRGGGATASGGRAKASGGGAKASGGRANASGGRARASTGQRGGVRASGGRPLPRGDSFYTPGAGETRRWIERASARPLVLLHQLPRWLVPIVLVGMLVAGLTVPGVGAAALVVIAAFLGWLSALSWPALTPNARLLRLAAIAGVLVLAGIQASR